MEVTRFSRYFPEDVWAIIKAFLLVNLDGVLWEKICEFQEDGKICSLELKTHLYYRVLMHTDINFILKNVLEIMTEARKNLDIIQIRYISDYTPLTEEDADVAMGSINALRLADKFLDVYGTAHIKELLERMDEMGRQLNTSHTCLYSNSTFLHTFIEHQYTVLHNQRKRTPNGIIYYIWEIETMEQVEKIQEFCLNPVTVIERHIEDKNKIFVIGYNKNRNSFWISADKKKTDSYIQPRLANSIGLLEMDYIFSTRCRFKYLLSNIGFPLTCVYH